jgi:CheY-like chemotaxis protein
MVEDAGGAGLAEQGTDGPKSGQQEVASMPLRGVTVLVVEDDPDSRETTGLLLQHLGARVVTVENGDRGLAAVLLHQPDVVLVDLVMPEMDGFEFARRIRSDPKYRRVRLVALTGLRDEATVLKTWSLGFDGHLTKPVTEEGLDILSRFTARH